MPKLIQKLRGTKDLIGKEALLWECVEKAASDVFRRYGYLPVRTPILEETDLFKRSVGEVTDIVQKEMYTFEDRSGTSISLRPEGTAGIVRAFIENHWGKEQPVQKLYYFGPMFRAERPQAGRLRQFHQIGVEYLGSHSLFSDVEVMEVLVRYLEELGLEGFKLQINNLGSLEDRKRFSEVLRKYFKGKEDQLCRDCKTRVERNVFRVLDCKQSQCQSFIEKAPRILDHVSEESRKNFDEASLLLEKLEIPFEINPRIVRGLDYYTDTVFELVHPALGAQDVLAAGGRYNGLVSKLGGSDIPAVGYALGVERLMIALQERKSKEEETPEREERVSLIGLGEEAQKKAYFMMSRLRKEGIASQMDFEGRSMKACLRQADKSGSRFVMILGENELKKGTVVLKDMNLSGEGSQREIPEVELVTTLRKEL